MPQTFRRAVVAVPANNTTMERELNALCSQIGPFDVARVTLPGHLNLETLPEYEKNTLDSVAPFLTDHTEMVVHGCTAAGFLAGPAGTQRIMEALRKQSGAIVVSTASGMVDVLRHEGVRETAVVTPYLKPVNDGLRAYLDTAGISVEVLDSMECQTVEELGQVTEDQVYDHAVDTVTPKSRSLFIACSQLPTLGILDALRERLGIPVWSSISATAWAASRAYAAHHPGSAAE
jgi:maleate cis-trans isomerase